MKSPTAAAPHFLDTLPFDVSHPGARELLGILAPFYWRSARAGTLRRSKYIGPNAADFEAMTAPRTRNRLRAVIDQVLADPEAETWHGRIRELVADADEKRAEAESSIASRACQPCGPCGLEERVIRPRMMR